MRVYMIEKGWIDPMENHIADGYYPIGFLTTEEEAKTFCEKGGFWTTKDCWSIKYMENQRMAKFRYKLLQLIK